MRQAASVLGCCEVRSGLPCCGGACSVTTGARDSLLKEMGSTSELSTPKGIASAC